jgi:uncharacterized repeat protein (TIGR01451 family)
MHRWGIILLIASVPSLGQATPVNINSGNPRYPFPQFMPYGNLGNLATQNSPGVPHAEMEQWIRDGWQIFANEFTYTGVTVGGVQYIKANNGCPYDCTEGDGYALLAAAYMGDKQTFDGIWMRFHDLRLNYLPRYQDGVIPNPGYLYGDNPKDNTDSAADGDFDSALGIVMAWYQWGDNSGITVFGGGQMNYRTEATYAVDALVAKYRHFPPADCRTDSGDIGYDGYVKGGNTWGETTTWANGQCPDGPEFQGPTTQYVDYMAPAYFNCFSSYLQGQGFAPASWDVTQLQAAGNASDWVMSKLIGSSAQAIPYAGQVAINGTTPTFNNVNSGEDFRLGWRTILNYVWNGNPATSWNPATHQVQAGPNNDEQQAGQRFDQFLSNPQGGPWNNACQTYGGAPAGISFMGPATVNWIYTLNGIGGGSFNLNWLMGTGSPSAVAAQDFKLMGKLFRQCEIEWDVTTAGDNYLTSVPFYFHGFFRWLGMDILSGNHLNPASLVAPPSGAPPANMKVYKSVDRTYAFTGDTLTYWISYRNYACTTATGVQVTDTLPAEIGFVSAVPAPASAPTAGSSGVVSWNLPDVPGLQNQNYSATMGGITLVATVLASSGRFCNTVDIDCSNGSGWTSNEYPNHNTPVMERNCVDIVPQVMSLTQTASPVTACAGDKVTFTLNYMDNPGNWLNGGRPGVVVSFANGGISASSNQLLLKLRLLHAADEAYIDYSNYRISYFLLDAANPPGSWALNNTIYEGGAAGSVVVTQQALPAGPSWNQRVIVQFAPQLAAPAIQIFNYTGLPQRIHRGGTFTLRAVWQMHNLAWSNVNWADDWSADPLASDADGGLYFPITNDWTDPYNPNIPVTKWDQEDCETAPHTVNNVLVEEWDGYTWRRAFGNGPVAGRQLSNVVLSETLPACMTFGGFLSAPAGVTASAIGQNLSWSQSTMNINEADQIQFWVTMGSCGGPASTTAVFGAQNERSVSSTVGIALGAACGGTPSNSPSPTDSRTSTPSASPTATPSASPSATGTCSPSTSPTASPSRSASPSASPTATPSPSRTPSPSPSATATASGTPSATPTASPSASASASWTQTHSATASPSLSPSPTRSPSQSASPSPSMQASPTPSPTPSASASPSPSRTASATASASASSSPSRTPSLTPSRSESFTASSTASETSTPSPTSSASASATPTASSSQSPTPSQSFTASPTVSPTASGTSTASPSKTFTGSPSATATSTASPSPSASASATPSHSPSSTATASPSATPSRTPSPTPSATTSGTPTRTASPSATLSPSFSSSPSASDSPTLSPSPTNSPTFSASPTISPTFSLTATPSPVIPLLFSFDLVVFDSAGEEVRNLVSGGRFSRYPSDWKILNPLALPDSGQDAVFYASGTEFLFDGRNDQGQALSAGSYEVRLSIKDPFGKVTTFSGGVSILRAAMSTTLCVSNSAGELLRCLDIRYQGAATMPQGPGSLSAAVLATGKSTVLSWSNASASWDGTDAQGNPVHSGVYVLTLTETMPTQVLVKAWQVEVLESGQTPLSLALSSNPWRSGSLKVSWGTGEATVRMYNLSGELVGTSGGFGSALLPDLAYAPGVYLLCVEQGGQHAIQKLALIR